MLPSDGAVLFQTVRILKITITISKGKYYFSFCALAWVLLQFGTAQPHLSATFGTKQGKLLDNFRTSECHKICHKNNFNSCHHYLVISF